MPPRTTNACNSNEALKTIRQAFEEFEKDVNPTDRRTFTDMTLQQVRQALLDCEKDLDARGKNYNLRRIETFVHCIQHYSSSVDIVCNGTPYLAWIWSPITLILQVCVPIYMTTLQI